MPKKLTPPQIQSIIDELVIRAERYELEHVAKSKAHHPERRQEADLARRRAKTTRGHIQELAALLNP